MWALMLNYKCTLPGLTNIIIIIMIVHVRVHTHSHTCTHTHIPGTHMSHVLNNHFDVLKQPSITILFSLGLSSLPLCTGLYLIMHHNLESNINEQSVLSTCVKPGNKNQILGTLGDL